MFILRRHNWSNYCCLYARFLLSFLCWFNGNNCACLNIRAALYLARLHLVCACCSFSGCAAAPKTTTPAHTNSHTHWHGNSWNTDNTTTRKRPTQLQNIKTDNNLSQQDSARALSRRTEIKTHKHTSTKCLAFETLETKISPRVSGFQMNRPRLTVRFGVECTVPWI